MKNMLNGLLRAFTDYPIIILPVLIAAGFGISFYLEWRRRNALSALAASMGLLFAKDGPDQNYLESIGLEIFKLGRARKASNLMDVPAQGGQIQVFDYRYKTGGGKNSHTHDLTVALISCACEIPYFDLKPETFIYKVGGLLGFKDIDLPAFPLFSDKYRLTGPDAAVVHMFFTPARAAWFERNLGLRVQGAPGRALLFKRERRLPAEAWQGFIEEAKTFAAEVLR